MLPKSSMLVLFLFTIIGRTSWACSGSDDEISQDNHLLQIIADDACLYRLVYLVMQEDSQDKSLVQNSGFQAASLEYGAEQLLRAVNPFRIRDVLIKYGREDHGFVLRVSAMILESIASKYGDVNHGPVELPSRGLVPGGGGLLYDGKSPEHVNGDQAREKYIKAIAENKKRAEDVLRRAEANKNITGYKKLFELYVSQNGGRELKEDCKESVDRVSRVVAPSLVHPRKQSENN